LGRSHQSKRWSTADPHRSVADNKESTAPGGKRRRTRDDRGARSGRCTAREPEADGAAPWRGLSHRKRQDRSQDDHAADDRDRIAQHTHHSQTDLSLLSQSRPRTSDHNSHRSDNRRQVGCLLWSEPNPAAIKHSEVFLQSSAFIKRHSIRHSPDRTRLNRAGVGRWTSVVKRPYREASLRLRLANLVSQGL
jgi:hypothetical protein